MVWKRLVGNTDVGDDDVAAQKSSGQKHMRRLLAKEGDGQIGFDAIAFERTREIAMQAARHIDRGDRDVRTVQRFDDRFRSAFQRPREAGAEHRIDDEIRVFENAGRDGEHRPVPAPRHFGRIAFERIRRSQKRQTHVPAALFQVSRDDETVAAIVAGPAEHGRHARRPVLLDRVGGRAARIFHQRERRRPVAGGIAIRLVHLGDGQNLQHSLSNVRPRAPHAATKPPHVSLANCEKAS